ncbi:hypothetical protein CLCR_06465 [Cladophialophora carrionii]|uniref:Uncharacterized protein n=1 Tax=Cladophialophora carrionii TaxID=86049 RepID=A0A1C1C9T1_9EURO|nr:hypothetical protein CLCR_06465 [Cladophialophora carrionii]
MTKDTKDPRATQTIFGGTYMRDSAREDKAMGGHKDGNETANYEEVPSLLAAHYVRTVTSWRKSSRQGHNCHIEFSSLAVTIEKGHNRTSQRSNVRVWQEYVL